MQGFRCPSGATVVQQRPGPAASGPERRPFDRCRAGRGLAVYLLAVGGRVRPVRRAVADAVALVLEDAERDPAVLLARLARRLEVREHALEVEALRVARVGHVERE